MTVALNVATSQPLPTPLAWLRPEVHAWATAGALTMIMVALTVPSCRGPRDESTGEAHSTRTVGRPGSVNVAGDGTTITSASPLQAGQRLRDVSGGIVVGNVDASHGTLNIHFPGQAPTPESGPPASEAPRVEMEPPATSSPACTGRWLPTTGILSGPLTRLRDTIAAHPAASAHSSNPHEAPATVRVGGRDGVLSAAGVDTIHD